VAGTPRLSAALNLPFVANLLAFAAAVVNAQLQPASEREWVDAPAIGGELI
jgi:hypothetical protein